MCRGKTGGSDLGEDVLIHRDYPQIFVPVDNVCLGVAVYLK